MFTEVASQYRVIPGIAEFARGGLPAPAATDDGNEWTDGVCWLYCGQRWTRVLWIGPASVVGAQAPMYACGPCIRQLQERAWPSHLREDSPSQPAPPRPTVSGARGAFGRSPHAGAQKRGASVHLRRYDLSTHPGRPGGDGIPRYVPYGLFEPVQEYLADALSP